MATRSARGAGAISGIPLRRRSLLEAALGSAVFSGVAFGALSTVLGLHPRSASAQPDPLPSWRESAAKRAMVSFVSDVSSAGGPRFVAPEARVASFADEVQRFMAGAHHPRFGVPFFQLAYLPQLELISYLQRSESGARVHGGDRRRSRPRGGRT